MAVLTDLGLRDSWVVDETDVCPRDSCLTEDTDVISWCSWVVDEKSWLADEKYLHLKIFVEVTVLRTENFMSGGLSDVSYNTIEAMIV